MRWGNGDGEGAEGNIFFGNWCERYQWDSAFYVNQREVSAVMDVGFVSVIMTYIVLGSWRFGDDFPIVPAQTEVNFYTKEGQYLNNYISH